MGEISELLQYVRRTNPEMTREKLVEELSKSDYVARSINFTKENFSARHPKSIFFFDTPIPCHFSAGIWKLKKIRAPGIEPGKMHQAREKGRIYSASSSILGLIPATLQK